MAGFSRSIVIDAEPNALFDLIADLGRHPVWASDELTMQRTGEDAWRSTSVAKGRTFHADIVVTAVDPHRTFEFVVSDETGTYRHRFSVEPHSDGCRVTRTVTPESLRAGQWALYWLALIPVRRPALATSLEKLAVVAGSGFA